MDRGDGRESAALGESVSCASASPSGPVAERPSSTSCHVRASPRSGPERPARDLRPRLSSCRCRTCTASDPRSASWRLFTSRSKRHGDEGRPTTGDAVRLPPLTAVVAASWSPSTLRERSPASSGTPTASSPAAPRPTAPSSRGPGTARATASPTPTPWAAPPATSTATSTSSPRGPARTATATPSTTTRSSA